MLIRANFINVSVCKYCKSFIKLIFFFFFFFFFYNYPFLFFVKSCANNWRQIMYISGIDTAKLEKL